MTCRRLRSAANLCLLGASLMPSLFGAVPTYTKDVAPVLQKNCQVCHRPGEAGPFSMLTYERDPALGCRDERSGQDQEDAALVCGSALWQVLQCDRA